jgi:hypothetical protein
MKLVSSLQFASSLYDDVAAKTWHVFAAVNLFYYDFLLMATRRDNMSQALKLMNRILTYLQHAGLCMSGI